MPVKKGANEDGRRNHRSRGGCHQSSHQPYGKDAHFWWDPQTRGNIQSDGRSIAKCRRRLGEVLFLHFTRDAIVRGSPTKGNDLILVSSSIPSPTLRRHEIQRVPKLNCASTLASCPASNVIVSRGPSSLVFLSAWFVCIVATSCHSQGRGRVVARTCCPFDPPLRFDGRKRVAMRKGEKIDGGDRPYVLRSPSTWTKGRPRADAVSTVHDRTIRTGRDSEDGPSLDEETSTWPSRSKCWCDGGRQTKCTTCACEATRVEWSGRCVVDKVQKTKAGSTETQVRRRRKDDGEKNDRKATDVFHGTRSGQLVQRTRKRRSETWK